MLRPALPTTAAAAELAKVPGLDVLAFETVLPAGTASALQQELLQLGAVDVRELPASEWMALQAWRLLKPLEQRRVLAWLQ